MTNWLSVWSPADTKLSVAVASPRMLPVSTAHSFSPRVLMLLSSLAVSPFVPAQAGTQSFLQRKAGFPLARE